MAKQFAQAIEECVKALCGLPQSIEVLIKASQALFYVGYPIPEHTYLPGHAIQIFAQIGELLPQSAQRLGHGGCFGLCRLQISRKLSHVRLGIGQLGFQLLDSLKLRFHLLQLSP